MSGQVVQVRLSPGRHPYAYVWDGVPPLTVGDRVVVPGPPSLKNDYRGYAQGQVVAIGSDYPGPLEAIIERMQPR